MDELVTQQQEQGLQYQHRDKGADTVLNRGDKHPQTIPASNREKLKHGSQGEC